MVRHIGLSHIKRKDDMASNERGSIPVEEQVVRRFSRVGEGREGHV